MALIQHPAGFVHVHFGLVLSVDALLRLWLQRERDAGPSKQRDRETLEFMEGRVAVPLPEIDADERAAVANLMAQGMTAQAQRIASVQPRIAFTPTNTSKAAAQRARNKKRALQGLWDENRLHLQRRQRARWLISYASSPVAIIPSYRNGQWTVRWHMYSALATYPAPTPTHLDMEPSDVLFASTQSAAKVEAQWPQHAAAVRLMRGFNPQTPVDHQLTLVHYCGPDEYVCAVVGVVDQYNSQPAGYLENAAVAQNRWALEVERVANRVGRCTAIVPNSISLEQPMSRYEGMKGLYQMQAKLTALEYRAVAADVDPAIWFVESDTGGEIVRPADGPRGVVGHVRGGQLLPIHAPPGQMTSNFIDRLERSQRLEGGVSPDLGGESGTNIRTGRRGSDILAAVMDFPIQEAQETLAESQWLEDRLAIDTALACFPDQNRSWGGFAFTPAQTFTKDDWHVVSYALAGADADGLVIRTGQLNGTGLMSKHTAREMIPDIKDGEFEDDMVTSEQITAGILAEFMQPGSFTLPDKARVAQLVAENKSDLADAIIKVQQEAQQRQAPDVNPVSPGAPEAQPGIAPPGAGAEAGTVGPTPNMSGLTDLLNTLRRPQRSSPQEQQAQVTAAR